MIESSGALKVQDAEGMRIEWDVPIPMQDGVVLRCDVFRPLDDKPHPVIMSYGPYGKWLHFAYGFAPQWDRLAKACSRIICSMGILRCGKGWANSR